jgi:hypothetical protein
MNYFDVLKLLEKSLKMIKNEEKIGCMQMGEMIHLSITSSAYVLYSALHSTWWRKRGSNPLSPN